jgi:hypothetical protein
MGYIAAEHVHVVDVLEPATDAAGRNSLAVSLKAFTGIAIVEASINQGNAATIALTLQQCTAVAGTGAKALTVNVPIYVSQDVAGASGDVLARQTSDGVAFTTSAAVTRKTVRFVIDPATLDLAGGFDCIRFTTGASNVANLTSGRVILFPKYPQASGTSARLD